MFEGHTHPSGAEGRHVHSAATHSVRSANNGYLKKQARQGSFGSDGAPSMTNGHGHSHEGSVGGREHKHTASCSHSHPSHKHTRTISTQLDTYEPGKRSSYVAPAHTHNHSISHSHSDSHSHSHHSHGRSHGNSLSNLKMDISFGSAPARKFDTIKPITFLVPILVTVSYVVAELYALPGPTLDPLPTTPRKEGVYSHSGIAKLLSSLSYASTLGGMALILNLVLPWKIEWKGGKTMEQKLRAKMQDDTIQAALELALGVLASFFAVVQLGAVRAALFITTALAVKFDGSLRQEGLVKAVKSRRHVSACLLGLAAFDVVYWKWDDPLTTSFAYVLLFGSLATLREPVSLISGIGASKATSLKAGLGLIFLAVVHWTFASASVDDAERPINQRPLWVGAIASGLYAFALAFSTPRLGPRITNPLVPLAVVATAAVLSHFISLPQQASLKDTALDVMSVAVAYGAALADSGAVSGILIASENTPHPDGAASKYEPSRATKLLIELSSGWPLLRAILAEKDSRRIFYFMLLNFGFMIVQTMYGFWTGSLGLLSDSIHMLFDCIALGVGLAAAVLSKRPASLAFPYGLGSVDTLAGFANGIFLMLISVEIIVEAIERLHNPTPMNRLNELLTVSFLGFLVNMVGMAAFGHHHHGHDHGDGGHSHSHETKDHDHGHGPCNGDHDHKHDHGHDHGHDHDHDHDHHGHSHDIHSHSHEEKSWFSQLLGGHDHGHSHGHNENMEGIFLHVLADTMGSLSVCLSTALIKYFAWPGFDPLASMLIAILIFASAVPLVKNSAKRLLLTVPDNIEYTLREKLGNVSAVHGVQGYSAPKFWVAGSGGKVHGVIHIQVQKGVDSYAVKERVTRIFGDMDVLIQMEVTGAGEAVCWCGGGREGGQNW